MEVIKIEDMTKNQSLDYLKQNLKISNKDVALAESIYSLVGGRLTLMNQVVSDQFEQFDRIYYFLINFFFSNIHPTFFQQKLRQIFCRDVVMKL